MAKKPYIFVIFQGGGGGSGPPPPSPLDQHMDCPNSVDDDPFCSRQKSYYKSEPLPNGPRPNAAYQALYTVDVLKFRTHTELHAKKA